MKIAANVLHKFLDLSTVKGAMPELRLNFKEDGLTMQIQSADNIIMVTGKLNKKSFVSYEAIGEIGLKNVGELMQVVGKFQKEEITVSKETNLLKVLGASTRGQVELPDLDFIKKFDIIPKLNYEKDGATFKINMSEIREAYDRASIFIKKKEELEITINGHVGKITLLSGKTGKMEKDLKIETVKSDMSARFGFWLNDLSLLLDGIVVMKYRTDFPITIIYDDEEFKFEYIIAPLVLEEDVKK